MFNKEHVTALTSPGFCLAGEAHDSQGLDREHPFIIGTKDTLLSLRLYDISPLSLSP
jgi:hypothetical protein